MVNTEFFLCTPTLGKQLPKQLQWLSNRQQDEFFIRTLGADAAVPGGVWRATASPFPEGLGQTCELMGVRELLSPKHKI